MTDEEFETYCDELEQFINQGPGVNEPALKRVRAIVFSIRHDYELTGYVKEKALEAETDFAMWFSARKWQKYRDGTQLRTMLYSDIAKLRSGTRRPLEPNP